MKNKRWTENEDKLLTQLVKKYYYNKKLAFVEAEKKLNRSFYACSFRWYRTLSNPQNKKYKGVCFTMLSHNHGIANRNTLTSMTKDQTVSFDNDTLWNKIKRLFTK